MVKSMMTQQALLKVTDYDMKLTTFAIQFRLEAEQISPEVVDISNELLSLVTKLGQISQKHREEGFKVETANAAS